MNRKFDGISINRKPIRQPDIKPEIKKIKPKSATFYYFYKSLQVVLVCWIIIIVVIISHPWLDYWVKSAVKNNNSEQVLGENSTSTKTQADTSANNQSTANFSVKNDKIKISAPIVQGISNEDLKKGIGHHPESVWPNEKGNVVIAGHNVDLDAENPYGKVFFDLRSVEIGDEVTINYQGNQYIYKVFRQETVSAKDVSLFEPADDWILTFYTCDPPYTDWERLVFQAKLIKIN